MLGFVPALSYKYRRNVSRLLAFFFQPVKYRMPSTTCHTAPWGMGGSFLLQPGPWTQNQSIQGPQGQIARWEAAEQKEAE